LVGNVELESGVINTGQVASAAWLVLLWVKSKGVHVNTNSRDVGVVLVRLHFIEIAALTHLESVMAVELEESRCNRVLASHTLNTSHGVTRVLDSAVPEVRVVERLLTLVVSNVAVSSIIAINEGITLDNPDELLARVVEVELDLVAGGSDGFATSELEGFDEVFMGNLSELAALFSVEEDVVNIEGGSNETSSSDTITDHMLVGSIRGHVVAEVAEIVELEVDTHFMVLESNERESKTRVAAEPELERDVESVFRSAHTFSFRHFRVIISTAVAVTVNTS
jgi:hypothetical protein